MRRLQGPGPRSTQWADAYCTEQCCPYKDHCDIVRIKSDWFRGLWWCPRDQMAVLLILASQNKVYLCTVVSKLDNLCSVSKLWFIP
uniref:Uncharacterized protein n=1 Tax=Arundo donax TaxID=35708 RepID=A0A0A9ERQ4_ARUDO